MRTSRNTVIWIVKHTEKDEYWGDGGDGSRNRLGRILMRVREELRDGQGS
jgi:predicted NAD-dependent protein-ADP-ribosyltransferase YbiA (DUF1768 family)